MTPKVLIWDLECTPLIAYSYGPMWQTNLIEIIEYSRIYSVSFKYYGEKKIHFRGLKDYPGFKKDPKNDKELVTEIYNLIKDCDISVAHNGDKFDIKQLKTRAAFHGLNPLPIQKTVDTCKILKTQFSLPSNSLDSACQFFGLQRKKPSDQKGWIKQMEEGDLKVWAKIKKYNDQDVLIGEELYKRIKSWDTKHPNVALIAGEIGNCPRCGKDGLKKEGHDYNQTGMVQQYSCRLCKAWSRGKAEKLTSIR